MQELEKILEEIELEKKRASLSPDCSNEHAVTEIILLEKIEKIIRKHMNAGERFEFDFTNVKSFDCQCGRHYVNTGAENNDGWIPVDERLPEDGTDVLVVLKPTYESDYIEYSIARYLCFENDEAHWCDNHYGYLEWDKYSDGHGGSSEHKVIAWQLIEPYRTERSE